MLAPSHFLFVFFFNDTATTEIYTLSLHDALPIWELRGRVTLGRKVKIFPIECVVRGFITGSGWKEYLKTGRVCGHKLPKGLKESQQLPEPLFTPSTKADEGHDENISEERAAEIIGQDVLLKLKTKSLALYKFGFEKLQRDRKSTRLNSSHTDISRMPSSA